MRAQVIGQRVHGDEVTGTPTQLALQIALPNLAFGAFKGRQITQVAVFIRRHEGQGARQIAVVG
ncbi:hypothetical protein D3C71_1305270 [compost metagenome]